MPIVSAAFQRNFDLPLCDDAKNPGAINVGLWSDRYGAISEYTYKNNTTAVFPAFGHGIAALMDLIMNHRTRGDVVTVNDYICGHGNVSPDVCYAGPNQDYEENNYIKCIGRAIDIFEPLNGTVEQLHKLVQAHHRCEGGATKINDYEFTYGLALLRDKSPNLTGTEVGSVFQR